MPAQPNQSLADGILLLGLLCSTGRLGTLDAARTLGWEPTRANRLLGTLRDIGLAEQDSSRQYLPGPGIHVLAAQCLQGSGLLAIAMPILREVERPGLGLAIGVLWRGDVCYLLHAEPGETLDAGLRDYTPYPANKSSIGLILEAHLEPANPVNSAAVRSKARKLGYAVNPDSEAVHRSVAVPIFGGKGLPPIAGLAFIGNLEEHRPADLAERLQVVAQQITDARILAHRRT